MPREKKPFVDFRDIRSRITMEQVLEHYDVLDSFSGLGKKSLSGPCPIHKGSNPTQFRVDTEKNIWHCFSECKHGGNVLDFIAKMENVSIHAAALKACEWFNIPIEDVKTSSRKNKSKESKKTPEHPAKTTPKTVDNAPNPPLKFKLDKLQREHPYLVKERGLTLETVIDFGLGFFTGDKGLMVGRVVIPIHNVKGELVAYAGRWPGEPPNSDTPKYKLPLNFKKGQELFNLDRALKQPANKPLVIVEGFFDAIKLHQNGCRRVVALMGSSLSPAQEELIKQHINPGSHIIVMLDEDEAGMAGRDDISVRLAKFCYVRVHQFGQPGSQPDHLSADDLTRILIGLP